MVMLAETECTCVENHSPNVIIDQDHHIVPVSWVKLGAEPYDPPTRKLCGTTHDSSHTLLNEYRRHGGKPPWGDHVCLDGKRRKGRNRYNALARQLAQMAWDRRPTDRPPWTTAHGGDPHDDE